MPPHNAIKVATPPRAKYQDVGLILGVIAFITVWMLPVPQGLSTGGWHVVALILLMACWWSTEAIPVPATSLLPIVALPMMSIGSMSDATHPYAAPVIFLLLGGFIVAMGMLRWNLHRRIALNIITRVGDHPAALIAGFMAASALLSMWISNTATTLMMIPIALSVAETVLGERTHDHRFTLCLLLGVAWASSIGGLGTIIGTPPNAFVVGFMEEEAGVTISFLQWMKLGVPIVFVMLPIAWLTLIKIVYPFDAHTVTGGERVVHEELDKLGRITTPEFRVAMVFFLMAVSWIIAPQLKITGFNNSTIAIGGAMLMFLVPAGTKTREFLLDWESTVKLPWGVLLLFGGGLSLAGAIKSTGLAIWLGAAFSSVAAAPLFLLMFAIVIMVIFLTELTSNTATTAALVPVLAAIAIATGIDPILLAAPTAMAASCAFMLPVATAPNAVIYSTGHVSIPQMAKGGLVLNIFGTFIVSALCYWLVPIVFA